MTGRLLIALAGGAVFLVVLESAGPAVRALATALTPFVAVLAVALVVIRVVWFLTQRDR